METQEEVASNRTLVKKLHQLQGGTTDFESFEKRIRTVLRRFDGNEQRTLTKKFVREDKSLKSLERHLSKAVDALGSMSAELRSSIDSQLLLSQIESRLVELEPTQLIELPDMRSAADRVSELLAAVRETHSSSPRQSGRPNTNAALAQLVVDLGAVFESGTGLAPSAHCYFGSQSEEYRGGFYRFVEAFISGYRPEKFYSNAALGKAIQRALKP